MVVLSTLGFDELEQLLVIVHAPVPPSDADWEQMMQASRDALTRIKGCLVVAGESTLDANKRRGLAETLKGRNLKVAVMVASPLARGMVTALGWLVGGYRAFGMNDFDEAFDYMQVPVATRTKARSTVSDIQQSLGRDARAGGGARTS